jgi:hypothetical protein
MKRALAVALLLMSFGSVALADGPGMSPPSGNSTKPLKPVLSADGPGMSPPTGNPGKPSQREISA